MEVGAGERVTTPLEEPRRLVGEWEVRCTCPWQHRGAILVIKRSTSKYQSTKITRTLLFTYYNYSY